ncbi:uncharacterized protein B0J16DRAFT_160245 [Fusarium flagelliforme]|uniref:uncharacterized protein n=1 Tax=Fusarium flagelliforme TaxID=2675880 RepID=UPI001E8E8CDE|nr:uncharacterized protein B0J16DRAFT_160245 [Fusarium flagelliforme]KAH7183034.1 hypothetical protein B0J16DRAFT_160245 [Fusarium flagelliforme]
MDGPSHSTLPLNPVSVFFSKSSQPALFWSEFPSWASLSLPSLLFSPLFCFALHCASILESWSCVASITFVTSSAPTSTLIPQLHQPPSKRLINFCFTSQRKEDQDFTTSASYYTPSRPRHTASRVPLVVQPHLAVATRLIVLHNDETDFSTTPSETLSLPQYRKTVIVRVRTAEHSEAC